MFRQATAGLERYFEFQRLNTNWKTEILAGLTTFITMAYIVFVNPSILKDAGMPVAAVFAATCLSAAFATILMGAFARYPIALAPGMGLNAYFTYTVVKGMGVPWETALGAVFLSGVAFLILTWWASGSGSSRRSRPRCTQPSAPGSDCLSRSSACGTRGL